MKKEILKIIFFTVGIFLMFSIYSGNYDILTLSAISIVIPLSIYLAYSNYAYQKELIEKRSLEEEEQDFTSKKLKDDFDFHEGKNQKIVKGLYEEDKDKNSKVIKGLYEEEGSGYLTEVELMGRVNTIGYDN